MKPILSNDVADIMLQLHAPDNNAYEVDLSDSDEESQCGDASIFVYERGKSVPMNVTHVRVHSTDRCIPKKAFENRYHLVEIVLNDSLEWIEENAFWGCKSLTRIHIPPSVREIGKGAFYKCTALKEVYLQEGIKYIGRNAFDHCTTLLGITIPSSLHTFHPDTFTECTLMRNVAIVSATVRPVAFEKSFPSLRNMALSINDIGDRFAVLPLHKHCFTYHPLHCDQTTSRTNLEQFNLEVVRLRGQLSQLDCLGMTPLHVLACSAKGVSTEAYHCIIEQYPEALCIKDRWGDIPLTYVLLSEASMTVIHYLFTKHKRFGPTMPFDFGHMILRLSTSGGISEVFVRNLIRAQRTHFPDIMIDWQSIVDDYIMDCKDIEVRHIPMRMFQVLVEASLSNHFLSCMSEEQQALVDEYVLAFYPDHHHVQIQGGHIVDYLRSVRDFITYYAQQHLNELKEATTILELALWKAELSSRNDDQKITRDKCRTLAGRCAEVVIKLMISYL
jgi:hypothetical protein